MQQQLLVKYTQICVSLFAFFPLTSTESRENKTTEEPGNKGKLKYQRICHPDTPSSDSIYLTYFELLLLQQSNYKPRDAWQVIKLADEKLDVKLWCL